MGAASTTQIRWVNHASFVLSRGYVRLITDPWLLGSAFNDGWDLICESPFDVKDFSAISHIWVSHEHPDHFSVPTLRAIPEADRRRIEFLYQKTSDGKVKGFCEGLGFSVTELDGSYRLSDRVSIRSKQIKDDSWLLFDDGETRILNLNDCIVRSKAKAELIRRECGPIDVLLTQFSYAAWEGNPEDVELRKRSAQEVLDRMSFQIEVLEPRYVIPCASFVWFSNEDNFYMNDCMNTISSVADHILAHGATPIVLYPGDVWAPPEDYGSSVAILRYSVAVREMAQRQRHSSDSVSIDELTSLAAQTVERVKRKNQMWAIRLCYWLGIIKPTSIYLTDHARSLAFNLFDGLTSASLSEDECDISMHSDSLRCSLRDEWGSATVQISGRFRSPRKNSYLEFFLAFLIPRHNNSGRSFPFGVLWIYLKEGLLWRMLRLFAHLRLSKD